MRPLSDLVRRWREQWPGRTIPWFDPDDGGIGASTLVLMEAPGPRTAAAGDKGLCSEDNDDPTAGALRRERDASGLPRNGYVRWNVVPWLPIDATGNWTAPKPSDLEQAMTPLAELVRVLDGLRLIIAVGRPALHGWTAFQTRFAERLYYVLSVPHPSQRNTRARTESLARLRLALGTASALASSLHAPTLPIAQSASTSTYNE